MRVCVCELSPLETKLGSCYLKRKNDSLTQEPKCLVSLCKSSDLEVLTSEVIYSCVL